MEDIFGNLEDLDPELFKKAIKEKKEEFIKRIKNNNLVSNTDITEISNIQPEKENIDFAISTPNRKDLDVFSNDLQNMGIQELKLELESRKTHYKKIVKNKKVVEIAQDLSHLEMMIKFMSSHSPEISNYKPSFIYRRIKKRISKLKMDSLTDYSEYLKLNLNEIASLKTELSINVTQFMRDRKTWEYLESIILPKIILGNRRKITFWSAATAIGCEAYSLAIINHNNSNTRFEVISTDVNNNLLAKARLGYYNLHHLKELSESEIKKYFTYRDHQYKIKSHIKKSVRFYKLNLFSDIFPKKIDIILARNVWIYFENPELIYIKMYNSLNCKGYLVLGGTEIVPKTFRHMFKLVNVSTQTYQKICN